MLIICAPVRTVWCVRAYVLIQYGENKNTITDAKYVHIRLEGTLNVFSNRGTNILWGR